MNNKTGLILRLILGGYLVFLGVSVIYQAVQAEPSDMVTKVLFGTLFILVGGAYAIAQIRKVYQLVKKETEDTIDDNDKNSNRPFFKKPQHDESLYRTAPMPTETIAKKMPAQSTDLRANMSHMKEEEKEAATQAEQNEAKEQVEQAERNENKEIIQNKEKAEQNKQSAELVEPETEAQSGKEEVKKQEIKEEQSVLKTEKKSTVHVEKKEADKNPEKQEVKPQSSQLGIQIEEKKTARAEVKDPVNLAIEIMRNEDKELAEQAEELEKDYEEK